MAALERWRAGIRISLVVIAAVLAAASQAQAQCRVQIDAAVSFGPYDVFNTSPVDTTGRISWHCPGNAPRSVQITITKGNNHDGISRRLAQGGLFLRYDLYLDANRTLVWGDGTYGNSYTAVSSGGGWIPLIVYARIPAEQDVGVGAYADSVTVVLNF